MLLYSLVLPLLSLAINAPGPGLPPTEDSPDESTEAAASVEVVETSASEESAARAEAPPPGRATATASGNLDPYGAWTIRVAAAIDATNGGELRSTESSGTPIA